VQAKHIHIIVAMAKISVFLSHITSESKLADLIKQYAQRDFIGLVEVFVSSDRTTIPVGSKWLEEITNALNKSELHIVLCSPESIRRPWINFEAGAAHVRNIPIVPICHSGLTPAQLPVPLSEYEGIVLSTEEGMKSFYRVIANALGSEIPTVDFGAYVQEISSLEITYNQRRTDLGKDSMGDTGSEIVKNPRALCISSPQFLKLGFENQLQKVLEAFPPSVEHSRVFDSQALQEAISRDRFDVVHIAAFICPRTGDLYFSDVDLNTGQSIALPIDRVTADGLAALLQMCEAKLAVITSCDSVALAASLISASHVVAARDMVSSKMMAAWVEAFYGMLPRRPLSQALEFAIKSSGAPMRLYAKQPRSVDLILEVAEERVRLLEP
jgi:hypothetical protein